MLCEFSRCLAVLTSVKFPNHTSRIYPAYITCNRLLCIIKLLNAKVRQFKHSGRQLSSLVETKEAFGLPLFSDEICHGDVLLYKELTCDDGAADKVLDGNLMIKADQSFYRITFELFINTKWVILNCVVRIYHFIASWHPLLHAPTNDPTPGSIFSKTLVT